MKIKTIRTINKKVLYELMIIPLFLCMIKEIINVPLMEVNQFAWFIILLIGILLFGTKEKKTNQIYDKLFFVYALIMGYMLVSGIVSAIDKKIFLGNFSDVFCCLSVAYVVGKLPYDAYRNLLKNTVHIADVVFLIEFVLWRVCQDKYILLFYEPFLMTRNMASFLSPNSYSLILAFVMMYHIDEFVLTRKVSKLIMAFLLLLPFISTASKSGIIVLLFGVGLEFLSHKNAKRRFLRCLVIAGICIVIMVILFSGVVATWLANYQDVYFIRRIYLYISGNEWLGGRGEGYRQLFVLFLEQPILGVGFSNINSQSGLFDSFSSPHSEYLKFLTEGGIVGFILLLILFITLLYCSIIVFRRNERKNNINLIAIYSLMFLVAEVFYNYFSTPREGFLLAFFGFGTVCFYKEKSTYYNVL